ncbi:MAG: cyclodeaminase/cyclohydrolase family protein [Clostridiales bacterium]|nr:cyclodeaminase/cyclohydrolase family protein [Clostridiales bacterium]
MTKKLIDHTIEEFASELASSSPAPGGGSVGALCGVLAAGLVSMVASLTVGKEKYAAVEENMQQLINNAEKLRKELQVLVDKDAEAFNGFMAAMKLPKETTEEKIKRSQAMQEALRNSCVVPLRIAELTLEIANLAAIAAEEGNSNAVTDAGVAARLCEAAFFAGSYNVRVNLLSLKDEGFKESATDKLSKWQKELKIKLIPVYNHCENELAL